MGWGKTGVTSEKKPCQQHRPFINILHHLLPQKRRPRPWCGGFAKDLEEAMTHGELSSFLESMGISTDDVWTAGPGGGDQVV